MVFKATPLAIAAFSAEPHAAPKDLDNQVAPRTSQIDEIDDRKAIRIPSLRKLPTADEHVDRTGLVVKVFKTQAWVCNRFLARFDARVLDAVVKPQAIADVNHPPFLAFAVGKEEFVIVFGVACDNKRPDDAAAENGTESLAFCRRQYCKEIQYLLDIRHLVVFAFPVGILHSVSHKRHQRTVIRQIDVGFFAFAEIFEGLQLLFHHAKTFVQVVVDFRVSIGDNIRRDGFEIVVLPVSIAVESCIVVAVDDGVIIFLFQSLCDVVKGGGVFKEEGSTDVEPTAQFSEFAGLLTAQADVRFIHQNQPLNVLVFRKAEIVCRFLEECLRCVNCQLQPIVVNFIEFADVRLQLAPMLLNKSGERCRQEELETEIVFLTEMMEVLEDVEVHDEGFPAAGCHPIREHIFVLLRAGEHRIRQETLGEKQCQDLVIPEFEILPCHAVVVVKEVVNFF